MEIQMRVSLRKMFLALTAFAIIIALVASVTKDYRRELGIHKDLVSMGADYVDVDIEGRRTSIRLSLVSSTTSPEITKYQDIYMLTLQGVELNRETLAPLTGLKNLEFMFFDNCTIDNARAAEPLRNLSALTLVVFSNCTINEQALDDFRFGPHLHSVYFTKNNRMAPDAIQRLLISHPKVRFYEFDGLSGATSKVRIYPESTSSEVNSTAAASNEPELASD